MLLLTGYEPCALTSTVRSLCVDGLTLAFAQKSNSISLLCKPFSFLSKFCKFWDLCLGKQGAWLVLHPLPLAWRLRTQVCCWSDLFLVLSCTPQGPKNRFYRKIGRIDRPLAWTTRHVRCPLLPHEVSRETAKF